MIILTSIIVFTGVFASWRIDPLPKEFFLWFCLLTSGVYGFFISLDLFTMFMYYEIALIPMYLLIGIWGTGRKEYAAMKLTLMLMGGSALLLVGILGIYFYSGGTSMNIMDIAKLSIPIEAQRYLFPLTFVGFGVLGALFPFHTWSPDGHASAPTAVSMLHAGVLMKLGGYGAFRVAMYLMPEAAHEMAWIFLILTGISVVYGAFSAVVQTDLKYINAYSSVSHCGLVLFAILMMNETALTGAVMQMLSHGLMTALFFALIGMIYGRTHTRLITQMGGLMKVIPFLGVSYVIAGMASLGLPGLSGFVAEMTIFVGAFQEKGTFHTILTIVAAASIVITAVYILRVVGKILYGPVQDKHHEELTDATWWERVSVVTLIIAIIALGSLPLWISNMIHDSLIPVVNQLLAAK
jgi:NADH-quinone oxidoreductase subunit M